MLLFSGILFKTAFIQSPFSARLMGGGLILMGVLGLLGVNVFAGGPLDLRRDSRTTISKSSLAASETNASFEPFSLIAIMHPALSSFEISRIIEESVLPECRSSTTVHSIFNAKETRFATASFFFGEVDDFRTIGELLSRAISGCVWVVPFGRGCSTWACWMFSAGEMARGYACDRGRLAEGYREFAESSQGPIHDCFKGTVLDCIDLNDIQRILTEDDRGTSATNVQFNISQPQRSQ